MQPSTYKHTAGYKSMMAYTLYQALMELNSKKKKVRKDAEEFLKSEDCENFCDAIGFNYELIKKINYENPSETLNFNARIVDKIDLEDEDKFKKEILTLLI